MPNIYTSVAVFPERPDDIKTMVHADHGGYVVLRLGEVANVHVPSREVAEAITSELASAFDKLDAQRAEAVSA